MTERQTNNDMTQPKTDLSSEYHEKLDANCFSDVPPDLLEPVSADDIRQAVDEVNASISSMLGYAQRAARSGHELPDIEKLVALDHAIGVYSVLGTEVPAGDPLAHDDISSDETFGN